MNNITGNLNNTKNNQTILTKSIAIAICTKNRNFNNEEYKKGVIEPYRLIKQMQDKIEKEDRLPAYEEMKQSLELLKLIFDTKKVPYEEQMKRFNEIFEETGTVDLFPEYK